MVTFPEFPLAELHAHLGTSISPSVLWQIAHESGIKLPTGDFEEFRNYIMLSPSHKQKLEIYFKNIYHPLLDRLSSGALAVEQATYQTMVSAYRDNVTVIELRNNPMKHNRNAEFDLDYIIMAMLRGMERALLECPNLKAGLIFCMAREFPIEQNAIILEKAIKYHKRGVVGIDVAGPAVASFKFKHYADIFSKAHKAGLKVTVHSGETDDTCDMWDALEYAKPQRIGHGIRAADDPALMKELVKRKVVLEVCPLSNLVTKAVGNMDDIKRILHTFVEQDVPFCINTDWPEVIEGCHLRRQYTMLYEKGLLSQDQLTKCAKIAFEASFVPGSGGLDAYL
ncbi:MAG TPA: adenosine deaminase [Patescibacteria group bacterium]|nr:adenosine deaminase [Patescibacteria group bacterium]